jgi:hypothetical protein
VNRGNSVSCRVRGSLRGIRIADNKRELGGIARGKEVADERSGKENVRIRYCDMKTDEK